jgi:hypothetical protein
MGNPSWGNGYHTGFEEGYDTGHTDGAKTGAFIGIVIGLAATGVGATARWGYKKIKSIQTKKRERELLAKESLLIDDEGDAGKESEDLSG